MKLMLSALRITQLLPIAIFLVISIKANSQPYERHNKTTTTYTIIGIRAGIWIPIGRLAKTFDPSPSYEFTVGHRGGDLNCMNLYASFTLPKNNTINFITSDTTVKTKAGLIFMAGFRWRDEVKLSGTGFFDFATTYFGIGGAGFFLKYKDAEGNRGSFGNVHMYIGWTFSKRVFNSQFVGITGQYNLIPQRGMREDVGRRFGNSSVNLGLEYRF